MSYISEKVLSFFLKTKTEGVFVCCNSKGNDMIVDFSDVNIAMDWFADFSKERGQKPFLANNLDEISKICKEEDVVNQVREDHILILLSLFIEEVSK